MGKINLLIANANYNFTSRELSVFKSATESANEYISDHFDFCKNFTTQIYPINYNEKSFFIKEYWQESFELLANKIIMRMRKRRER